MFIDNDVSAADPAVARPQWLAMLEALRCGEIDEVVAYDQSRLTRQPIEWEQLLVILGRRGIGSVQTVREGRPFSTPPPGGLSEPSWRNR